MKRRNGASKQNWRTPLHVFEAIERMLHVTFDIDGAADWDGGNALCRKWMARWDTSRVGEQPPNGQLGDALTQPWPTNTNIFINPPFKNIFPWVEAIERNWLHVNLIALLCPSATETIWFRKCTKINAHRHCYFLYPRVAYIDPDGEKKVSPPSGSCVWVFSSKPSIHSTSTILPHKPTYHHLEIRKP